MRNAVALVVLALALRGAAALAAPESDDLRGWRQVAEVLHQGGNPYEQTTRLNWPPLWMLWVGVAGAASRLTGLPFEALIRLLPFAADAAIILVLHRLAPRAGLLYAVHPVALTTTGAQAQFDAVPALGLLLGTVLLSPAPLARRGAAGEGVGATGAAGLLLGLAAGFKTWPLFAAPGLAARLGSGRQSARLLVLAAAVPAALLVPVALASPAGFERNVLHYRSYPGWWGLTSLGIVFPWSALRALGGFCAAHGGALLLATLSAAWLLTRRLRPHESALAALLAFLAATPGFGPQYLLWPLPFACLARGRAALAWHLATAAAVTIEFFVLPRVLLPPGHSAAEVAIAGNRLINELRVPAWIAGLVWLGVLLWQGWRRRAAAHGAGAGLESAAR